MAIGGVAAAAAASVALGARSWRRGTRRAVERMTGHGDPPDGVLPTTFASEMLEGLPTPVRRYFELALTPGQPLVRRAHLRWAGSFLARPPEGWSPFTAEQHCSVRPRGFVWDADIRMWPLLPTRVRDSYVAGEGAMLARVAAVVPVVDQHGTPEMAAASLLRYLAEATWYPTALLPCEGVRWDAIDENSARATITDGATTVSLDAHFGERGEIERISAMRHRDVKGTPVLTPWMGHSRDYQRVNGMMIPMSGEVEWLLPERRLPYWRGRIVKAEYDIAD